MRTKPPSSVSSPEPAKSGSAAAPATQTTASAGSRSPPSRCTAPASTRVTRTPVRIAMPRAAAAAWTRAAALAA